MNIRTTQGIVESAGRILKRSIAMLALSLVAGSVWAAPTLTVGSLSGASGSTINVPIAFDPTTSNVAGIQFNLTLPTGFSTGTITAGSIVTNAGKSVTANLNGNTWTFIVFGLNQTTIASGNLLTVQIQIAGSVSAGDVSLPISGVSYTDPNGTVIAPGTSTGGTITVTGGTPPPPPPPPPPPSAPVISSAGNATGTVGTAFSYQITASNSPTSFNATGLPSGLAINTATGLISGTPTAASTSTITLSATNAGGTGNKTLTLVVSVPVVAAPTLSVGSATGAAGTSVNLPITFNTGSGAVAGIQFNLTMPAGLSTGTITAGSIVTNAGKSVTANLNGTTWTFIIFGLNQTTMTNGTLVTVQIPIAASATTGAKTMALSGVSFTDANGAGIASGTNTNGTITVTAGTPPPPPPPPPPSAPVVTSAGSATGTVGSTFNYQITASNSPTSFNATGLPSGLSINTSNGLISGTPTSATTSNITVSATNSAGTGSKALSLTVNLPNVTAPTIFGGSVSGTAGTSVTLPLAFNNGPGSVAGVQFTLTIPAGLSTGTITPGAVVTAAGKSVSSNLVGSNWNIIIFGLNQTTISSGTLISIQIPIAASATNGTKTLTMSNVTYTDANGQSINPGSNVSPTVTVTGGTNSSVLTPTLNLPAFLKLNDTVTAGYSGNAVNLQFFWTFTPLGSGVGSSGSFAIISKAGGAPQTIKSAVGQQAASLASNPGLTTGLYQVTVHACDSSNNCSSESLAARTTLVPSDLAGIRVFPNPWRSDRHAGKPVTFDQLTVNTTIKIFTVSGHLVKSLPESSSLVTWNLDNNSGDKVASGIYIYLIKTDDGQKRTGQVVVIK